jgi:CO dehydrogenase/acetyl-CoA synthase beta subunit
MNDFLSKLNKALIESEGQTLSPEEVYDYIASRHDVSKFRGTLMPFLKQFDHFILKDISLYDIDLEQYELDTVKAKEYGAQYLKSESYPPIVVTPQSGKYTYEMIDGTHRANALKSVGLKTVKAYVGQNNLRNTPA